MVGQIEVEIGMDFASGIAMLGILLVSEVVFTCISSHIVPVEVLSRFVSSLSYSTQYNVGSYFAVGNYPGTP